LSESYRSHLDLVLVWFILMTNLCKGLNKLLHIPFELFDISDETQYGTTIIEVLSCVSFINFNLF